MSERFAIIAALPREVASLVKGVSPDAALRAQGIFLYKLPHAVVVAAGMGPERVGLAAGLVLEMAPGVELVSVGLAGGCIKGVEAGSVVECGMVVDVRTGERFGEGLPVLVTTEAIASIAEKARLNASYGASVVDMEAATVARLARAHGVGFQAVKGVSDTYDFELAGLSRFTGKRGQFRTGAFAVHVALRPWLWSKAVRLATDSTRALGSLTVRLREMLDEAE